MFTGSAWGVWDFKVTVQGSGISPVSSLADLETAFNAGLATGAFSSITVEGSKDVGYIGDTYIPTTEFLTVALSPTGYSLTSGSQVVDVKGSLPTDLGQFHTLLGIADDLSFFWGLSNARKAQIVSDLNSFGINELSISSGGIKVLELTVSPTEVSLGLLGYTASLIGSFPSDAGNALPFMFDLLDAANYGTTLDFSDIAGSSIDRIKVTNPDGAVVMRTRGDLATSSTISLDRFIVDGVKVVNPMFGDNTSNYVSRYLEPIPYWEPGDQMFGTAGKDHMFGLGGNDTLDGGNGNDFLFGGSGNDFLFGGSGNDLLNPGSNLGWDVIEGSRGNDTIVFTDSEDGYQYLSYWSFERGIAVHINGLTNVGSVSKGKFGTDTLVDVAVPMKAGMVSKAGLPYAIGGFQIPGSQFNDTFDIVTARRSFVNVSGQDGTDTFDLTISQGSLLRLSFYGPEGVRVNLATGVVGNDSFGNRETMTITNNGGQIELYGTGNDDLLIGGGGNDRFITNQGNDFVDGGAGADLIRYDRFDVGSVTVNLMTGKATGSWNGTAFIDTLRSIEDVRGSRDNGDLLIGSNKGNDIEGRGGNDRISGRGGRDDLAGGDGNDTINGGAGRDKLTGGAGNDTINGGAGRDKLTGGAGNDTLTGGGLKDVFVFDAGTNEGSDTITDFQDGVDRIKIAGAQFADLSISDDGSGAVVELSGGTEFRLSGMSSTDLGSGDFIFV